jgi:flagellar basal body-associated protein FliL
MADEKTADAAKPEEAAEKKADEAAVVDVKKGPASGVMLAVIAGFLVMSLTPLVCFFVVKWAMPAPVEKKSAAPADEAAPVLKIDAVIVNVAETKSTRVLRFQPHLVFGTGDTLLYEALKKDYVPMLSDRIIMAAGRKTIDELEGARGKDELKRDIIAEINTAIKDKMLSGGIVDVYFTEFVIQ